ncbi:MAG: leucine-rich repeat protein [Eubacterium sp.]|nr:leucine-rich repeat protein [Eubacterium sp.]
MKKTGLKRAAVGLLTLALSFQGMSACGINAYAKDYQVLTDSDLDELVQTKSYSRVAVHDPSIIDSMDGKGTYYIFGSHMGVAETTDFMNWSTSSINGEVASNAYYGKKNSSGEIEKISFNDAFKENELTGKTTLYKEDGTEYSVDFSSYDINNWISQNSIQGNQWAPDIIYNKEMGKWCLYQSLNGNNHNSAIVLLTADEVTGPFVYQGPVVFTGFHTDNNTETRSYKNTDLEIALGMAGEDVSEGLPQRYDDVGRGTEAWGKIWPHAIDPCVFYDDDGKLWMSYGSWSGGIYVLGLDEKTGLRDYSVMYGSDYAEKKRSVTCDPYFGKKIAGGYYVSGEGSYIKKIGNKYVLFMSYGFYSPEGGYEMRLFYSDKPDGPYVDTKGESAIYTSAMMNYGPTAKTTRGQKLMGNYQWDGTMSVGEISQGHNSATVREDGRAFVVYHTKFNDGTVSHQVRVHELFINEDGYVVASPYEFNEQNADISSGSDYADEEIAGDYTVMIHKYNTECIDHGGETFMNNGESVSLNADYSVTGAIEGTWKYDKATSFATITTNDNKIYKGVFAKQNITGTNSSAMTFSVMDSETGLSIWGSQPPSDDMLLAMAVKSFTQVIPSNTYFDLSLMKEAENGVTVEWKSSNPDALSDNGEMGNVTENTTVELTATFEKGEYKYTKTYTTVVVAGASEADIDTGLKALYDFNDGTYKNTVDSSKTGEPVAQSNATPPTLVYDKSMGNKVVKNSFGTDSSKTLNYTQFDNPLKGEELNGATISGWFKMDENNLFDTLWAVQEKDGDSIKGRAYLTPNVYVGYNGNDSIAGSGWFDANHPDQYKANVLSDLKWHMVTVSVDSSDVIVSVDGVKKYDKETFGAYNDSRLNDEKQDSSDCTYYTDRVLRLLSNSDSFYLGYGSWWGSAPFSADNIRIYDKVLNDKEVAKLYKEEKPNASSQEYNLNIDYKYEDGREAAESTSIKVEAGDAYSIPSPEIEGYSADKCTVVGNMQDSDENVTVTYKKVIGTVGELVDGSYVLDYADYTNFYKTEIAEGNFKLTYKFHHLVSPKASVWEGFSTSFTTDLESTSCKDENDANTSDGLHWDLRVDNHNNTVFNGASVTFDGDVGNAKVLSDSEVTVVVTRTGSSIVVDKTVTGASGKTLRCVATSKGSPNAAMNAFLGGENCLIKLYSVEYEQLESKPSHKITINYVDEKGEKVAETVERTEEEGAEYSVNSPEIDGMAPDIDVVTGVMGEEDLAFTVVYKKVVAVVGSGSGDSYNLDWYNYGNFHKTETPEGDFTLTYKFHNQSAGTDNYKNYAIAVTTDLAATGMPAAEASEKHWYLRSDAYTNYDNKAFGSITPSYSNSINWDEFLGTTKDSEVTAEIKRTGTTLSIKAEVVGKNGKTYYTQAVVNDAPIDAMNIFLGGESCKLTIYSEAFAMNPVDSVKKLIDALGDEITLEDEEKVKNVRAAYDKLTDEQKSEIPEKLVNKLKNAESRIAELKSEDAKPVDDGTKDNTKNDPKEGSKNEAGDNKPTKPEAGNVLKVGYRFTDSKNAAFYKITKVVKKNGTVTGGNVEYLRPVKKNVKSINIPGTVVTEGIKFKVTSVAGNALKNNKKLKSVVIGSNVTTIGANAFLGCGNLAKVTFKSKVLKTINAGAFKNCKKLKKISFPASLRTIGKQAFYNDKALVKITFNGTALKTVGAKAFGGINKKAVFKVKFKVLSKYTKLIKNSKIKSGNKILGD